MTNVELREAVYAEACKQPSDINEHLPTLRRLAEQCPRVIEMGMRTGVSTVALLAAQPKKLVSIDINPISIISQRTVDLMQIAGETKWQPRVADTLECEIEDCDMLFIDTLHTFEQLKAELWKHVFPSHNTGHCKCKVKKYLVFHDTSTFGFVGEDQKTPGLRAAIYWFQQNAFPLWQVVEDHHNNNGLTVLRHA